jgi:twitching motility protein PilT
MASDLAGVWVLEFAAVAAATPAQAFLAGRTQMLGSSRPVPGAVRAVPDSPYLPEDRETEPRVTDHDVLAAARAEGFSVLTDPETALDPAAVRLLPTTSAAVGVAVAGDVLLACLDHLPSPAEFAELEAASGMLITVAIADAATFTALRDRAGMSVDGAAPRSVAPALTEAIEAGASDVHLSVGSPPVLRIAGQLRTLERWPVLSAADLEHAARWLVGDDLSSFTGDHDCAVSYGGSRWRVSLYRQRQQLALALRRVPTQIPKLDQLSLPASVVKMAELTSGLVLFAGPTGSGKSTSMAALVDRINRSRRCHILTVEDPIEYVHADRTATIHQREVGDDTASFPIALRAAMRQDPDVILVGELRDLETMRTAIAAAETGHLVLATVHATSTAGVFSRLIDAFPAEQQAQVRTQLSASLQGVVAQQLLPATARDERQLVCEVLVATTAVRNMVRESRLHEIGSVLDAGAGHGMISMDRSLAEYVAAGRIAPEVAVAHVHDEKTYAEHLRRIPSGGVVTSQLSELDALDALPSRGGPR